jgi:hypothetical protein
VCWCYFERAEEVGVAAAEAAGDAPLTLMAGIAASTAVLVAVAVGDTDRTTEEPLTGARTAARS